MANRRPQVALTDPTVDLAEAEVAFRTGDYERALAFGSRAAERSESRELRSRSQLVAGRAAQLADQWAEATRWFHAAETSALATEVQACALWGELILCHESEHGDLDRSLKRFARADDGSVDHTVQVAHGGFMLSLARGDVDAALEYVERAVALRTLCADPLVSLSAINQLAWVFVYTAQYAEAALTADQVIAEGEASGLEFALNHGLLAKGPSFGRTAAFRGGARRSQKRWLAAEEPSRWLGFRRTRSQPGSTPNQPWRTSTEHATTWPRSLPPRTVSMRAEYYGYRALAEAAAGRPDEARQWIEPGATNKAHRGAFDRIDDGSNHRVSDRRRGR